MKTPLVVLPESRTSTISVAPTENADRSSRNKSDEAGTRVMSRNRSVQAHRSERRGAFGNLLARVRV
jgi:hypothetical protein